MLQQPGLPAVPQQETARSFRTLTVSVVVAVLCATPRAEHRREARAQSGAPTPVVAYVLDIEPIPGSAALAGFRLAVRNSSNALVRKFEDVDEKPFHLFVVGRDLKFFRHLYPTVLADGILEAREEIPPGEYLVAADFLPSGGSRQFLRRVVDLRGNEKSDSRTAQKTERSDPSTAGVFDIVTNVRIQPLPGVPMAGQRTAFHVMLSRTEDGRPLVNLEPYLGGGGYLLAVKEDLTEAVHAQAPPADLPVSLLTFDMTFPKAGAYVVWVEFRRFDETLAARLAVTAR